MNAGAALSCDTATFQKKSCTLDKGYQKQKTKCYDTVAVNIQEPEAHSTTIANNLWALPSPCSCVTVYKSLVWEHCSSPRHGTWPLSMTGHRLAGWVLENLFISDSLSSTRLQLLWQLSSQVGGMNYEISVTGFQGWYSKPSLMWSDWGERSSRLAKQKMALNDSKT
jgi:hypothetical protein